MAYINHVHVEDMHLGMENNTSNLALRPCTLHNVWK